MSLKTALYLMQQSRALVTDAAKRYNDGDYSGADASVTYFRTHILKAERMVEAAIADLGKIVEGRE